MSDSNNESDSNDSTKTPSKLSDQQIEPLRSVFKTPSDHLNESIRSALKTLSDQQIEPLKSVLKTLSDQQNESIRSVFKTLSDQQNGLFKPLSDQINSLNYACCESVSNPIRKSLISTLESLSNLRLKIDYTYDEICLNAHLESISDSYENRKLVLVLGAGTSKEFGLPNWNDLLQKLLIQNLEPEIEESLNLEELSSLLMISFFNNLLILARNIQQQCKNDSDEMIFEKNVRSVIYEKVSYTKKSPLLKEISQFCIESNTNKGLDSIITTNYDDILENCFSKPEIGIPFKSIYSAGMQSKVGELPIYHVHGFLPREGELDSKNKITLSEDLYHQLYTDFYCWSNLIQINKFTNNTCLIIGTSLNDPNLRRLLDVTKEQREEKSIPHYILKKRYNKQEVMDTISKFIPRTNEESSISEKEYDRKIQEFAQNIINVVEGYEEKDAMFFGVNTIWIGEHEEIPTILYKIRNFTN